MDTIRVFHDETNNRPDRRLGPHQVNFQRQPEGNRPISFKEYAGVSTVQLPLEPLSRRTRPAVDVLFGGHGARAVFDAASLSRILAYSAGITRVIDRPGLFIRYCRAASSAHSYPDVYVVCGDLDGIKAGVYYFHGLDLRLDRLREGDYRAALAEMTADPSIARRPVTLVIAGVPWRAAWRYGERALRHVYWDTGGLLANMVAIADADEIEARVVLGFVDASVADLVGLDGENEFPIALVSLGGEGATARLAPSMDARIPAPPISSAEPLVLPLIVDAQRAGDLPDAAAVSAWRSGQDGKRASSASRSPTPSADARSIEEIILRRGSTRRMLGDPLPRTTIEWILTAGTRPPSGDWLAPGQTLLKHLVVIHALEDGPAGLYQFEAHGLRVVREGDLREDARRVSLDQPQGGDGAFTTFHFADLDQVTAALGPRCYRAAQIEGGYALERLHLAAFASEVGATGLTFYDAGVSALCGVSSAVMTEVAFGLPAYRAVQGRLGNGPAKVAGHAFDLMSERWKELEAARSAAGRAGS
jgi:SagB-type dehydrogenase family enzyme